MLEVSAMLPELAAVSRNFERAAPQLSDHDYLYGEVRARLLERLDPIILKPKIVLDLGCGTGTALRLLRRRFPGATTIGLDLVHPLLRQAAARRWLQRSAVCQGDFHGLPFSSGGVDLIVANLSLHWAVVLPTLLLELRRVLSGDGMVLFSCFGPDTLQELRQAWHGADPGFPHVLACPDMHDLGDAFVQAGFAGPVLDAEHFCLTYSSERTLFAELQGLGLSNACQGRRRGLVGKQRWRMMVEGYGRQSDGGRLPATFEVVYGHAWVGGSSRSGGANRERISVPFLDQAGPD
ncbi:MAG: methyltransferase domain-containing protein [Gammaproteobacteria bacterium]|nr:methyltransferase domain-containing protein [Gammaproteobacteria bacterium]